jgi:soluble lytic murein transglycosylase-like protein
MRSAIALAVLLPMLLAPLPAAAGNQVEEKLSDSVRASRQASIAHKWIFEMSNRLQRRIPDRKTRTELLKTVHYEAQRNGLDPQLVLGVMEVESNFRKYAVSSSGARGYLQVMPFWTKIIGEPHHNLFALRTNLRYGCVILRHYLNLENGDYFRALGRYNGSLGRPEYPDAVHAAWRGRWKYDGATS